MTSITFEHLLFCSMFHVDLMFANFFIMAIELIHVSTFFFFSPEESSDAGLLIDTGCSQQNEKIVIQSADFTKLVDIEPSSLNVSNENFLINVDNVNSNILSSEKYSGFDDCLQKKSEASVAGSILPKH